MSKTLSQEFFNKQGMETRDVSIKLYFTEANDNYKNPMTDKIEPRPQYVGLGVKNQFNAKRYKDLQELLGEAQSTQNLFEEKIKKLQNLIELMKKGVKLDNIQLEALNLLIKQGYDFKDLSKKPFETFEYVKIVDHADHFKLGKAIGRMYRELDGEIGSLSREYRQQYGDGFVAEYYLQKVRKL